MVNLIGMKSKMRLIALLSLTGILFFNISAQADCTTRCRPNLFFPERTDCYTDCDQIVGSVAPYVGAASVPGRPPARMRFVGGLALGSRNVLEAQGNWAGMTPATLKTEAAFSSGGFYCLQVAGSPNLISLYAEMSGYSRELTANGIDLGKSSVWDLGLGIEVGHYVTDWIWLYGQVGGFMGTRDFAVSDNVPEQKDVLGTVVPATGNGSGFGAKVSLGLDVRITSNVFINFGWHYRPSQETYTHTSVDASLKGFKLDASTSFLAGGVSYHAD